MKPIGYSIGDLHWPEASGRGSWADMPGVHGDIEHALRTVVEWCVADDADLYLSGDNLDGPDPEPGSLSALYGILRPLLEAKRFLYYILGNHDRGQDWLSPLGSRAVRVEDGKPIRTTSGKTLCGLNYQDPAVFEEKVRLVPATAIGMYHQSFREWVGGGRGFPLSMLPNHLLALCGDTHVADLVTTTGFRLSPGPLVPQSTTEFCENMTVWAFGTDLEPVPRKLPGRTRVRFEVSGPDAADAVLARIAGIDTDRKELPSRLRQPVVAVRLTTRIDGFADVLRKLASDRGIHLRISDHTRSRTNTPTTSTSAVSLADAISGWPATQDVRDLALAVVSPGADVKTILTRDLDAEIAKP